MAIQYNTELLERLFAPDISAFTSCDAPDLTTLHPEARFWMQNHYLNAVSRGTFKGRYRQYTLNQLYRAQVVFSDYHEARSLTSQFLQEGRPDNPAVRTYFKAIARWESCLLNLQIFVDVMNKVMKEFNDGSVFVKGDGSSDERAYEMANTVKHWGSDLANDRHSDNHTIPLWLTNNGLHTRLNTLTYLEVANVVAATAKVADELQDPYAFAHPGAA